MVKNPPANAGDADSIPGLGESPGEGNGNPLQYSCLENHVDGEAWQAAVHGVAKSDYYTAEGLVLSLSLTKERGFPGGSDSKESACNAGDSGDAGLILGSGRSPGVGNGNPHQYSCLENTMNREAQWAKIHGATKSQT